MFFNNKSLKFRFITSISLFITVFILSGSIAFTLFENTRIKNELNIEQEKQLTKIVNMLEVTDKLIMDQTQSSMKVLINQGEQLGEAVTGPEVKVGDKSVNDLVLGSIAIANNFKLVDNIKNLLGGTSTVFTKQGDDYVRISTNVMKDDGTRAVGTVLDKTGKAYAAINSDQQYFGMVDILGNPFLTGYTPIKNAANNTIGIWHVGYKVNVDNLKSIVDNSKVLTQGFISITDNKGKIRFHSSHINEEAIAAHLKDAENWKVSEKEFAAWGFTVHAAYSKEEANNMMRGRIMLIVITGITACFLLISLVIVMLNRLVLVPLGGEPKKAVDIATVIANGDLRTPVNLDGAKDGSVICALSSMQEGLRTIVKNINESADTLETSSIGLVDTAKRVSVSVEQQNDSTSSIAATLEEITVSIKQVTDNAQDSSTLAERTGQMSLECTEAVNNTVTELKTSSIAVNKAADMIEELANSSKQISEIVNVIKDIAGQTKLLALNAAIEAARAGDQGRGFAVVADEVRKLAERTAISTQEIAVMIEAIQKSTAAAVVGIKDSASQVNNCVSHASIAGESMQKIYGETVKVIDTISEISNALKEQSSSSEQIAASVEMLANLNEENSAGVNEVYNGANTLQSLSVKLKETVSIFKV